MSAKDVQIHMNIGIHGYTEARVAMSFTIAGCTTSLDGLFAVCTCLLEATVKLAESRTSQLVVSSNLESLRKRSWAN